MLITTLVVSLCKDGRGSVNVNLCFLVVYVQPEGKRPLGRPTRRWVDNIRMDLQVVGFGYMDWIGLAQDRQVADACECGNEPSGSVKCGEFLD